MSTSRGHAWRDVGPPFAESSFDAPPISSSKAPYDSASKLSKDRISGTSQAADMTTVAPEHHDYNEHESCATALGAHPSLSHTHTHDGPRHGSASDALRRDAALSSSAAIKICSALIADITCLPQPWHSLVEHARTRDIMASCIARLISTRRRSDDPAWIAALDEVSVWYVRALL